MTRGQRLAIPKKSFDRIGFLPPYFYLHIFFRTDASTKLGLGHAMRCFALAMAYRKKGNAVTFLSRCLPNTFSALVEQNGIAHLPLDSSKELNWESDAHESTSKIVENGGKADWLIVDHYGLDRRWETQMRAVAERILVIDDLADRPHDCDILLDQTFGREKANYAAYVPANAAYLLGPSYALLRSDFARARESALKRRQEKIGIQRILISLGATDLENVTAIALKGIYESGLKLAIDVVLGSDAPHLAEIQAMPFASQPSVTVHVDVKDMTSLLMMADLAIGAGGTSTWERCCLGLPSLVVTTAENQKEIVKNLATADAIEAIGSAADITPSKVAEALHRLVKAPKTLARMSRKSATICDGLGTNRVLNTCGT